MNENERAQIKVRVSKDTKEWLDRKAKEEHRSLTYVVEQAIGKARKLEEMAA